MATPFVWNLKTIDDEEQFVDTLVELMDRHGPDGEPVEQYLAASAVQPDWQRIGQSARELRRAFHPPGAVPAAAPESVPPTSQSGLVRWIAGSALALSLLAFGLGLYYTPNSTSNTNTSGNSAIASASTAKWSQEDIDKLQKAIGTPADTKLLLVRLDAIEKTLVERSQNVAASVQSQGPTEAEVKALRLENAQLKAELASSKSNLWNTFPTYLATGDSVTLAELGKQHGFNVYTGGEPNNPTGYKWSTFSSKTNPQRRTVCFTVPEQVKQSNIVLSYNEKTGGFDVSPYLLDFKDPLSRPPSVAEFKDPFAKPPQDKR